MDQRTRRRFIQTIETFFPRELCGEMEEYTTFDTSLKNRDSGLNSDFVCGPLKDAVDSGEHIVKCVKTPWIHITNTNEYSRGRESLMMGYYFMISNKNRIVIYQPQEAVRNRDHTATAWFPYPHALKFIFYQLPEEFVDNDYRFFDFVVGDFISRFTKLKENPPKYGSVPFVQTFHPPFGSVKKAISLRLSTNDYGGRTQDIIRQWLSSECLITSYENLLRLIHSMVPQQQRVSRQRQRVVRQSSDRIGRSMTKIRDEFGRLETEMKKLGDLSSTLSTQRTFTVGQDGQFVSLPT